MSEFGWIMRHFCSGVSARHTNCCVKKAAAFFFCFSSVWPQKSAAHVVYCTHLFCSATEAKKMITGDLQKSAKIKKGKKLNNLSVFLRSNNRCRWKKSFASQNLNQSHFVLVFLVYRPDKIGKLYNLLIRVFVISSAVMQQPFPSLLGQTDAFSLHLKPAYAAYLCV